MMLERSDVFPKYDLLLPSSKSNMFIYGHTRHIFSRVHTLLQCPAHNDTFDAIKQLINLFIYVDISRSSQYSTTGVTKAVVCVILSVGWCI